MLKIIKDSTLVPTPIVDLKLDSEPRQGSTDPVTSEGVKNAIDGAVGDAAEALQEQIDDIAEKAGSGYIPKGEASVATLNGLSGQENGDLYTMTDAGTLTDGSLAVVAGDTVAWDEANSVWYKAMDYAPRQYGTNEVHNLATTATDADLVAGNYLAIDGEGGTKKANSSDFVNDATKSDKVEFSISDANGNIAVKFENGQLKTENSINNSKSEKSEFSISDANGNIAVKFENGQLKTENSARNLKSDKVEFSIVDSNGNVVAKFENGDMITKNFNSNFVSKGQSQSNFTIPFSSLDFSSLPHNKFFRIPAVTFTATGRLLVAADMRLNSTSDNAPIDIVVATSDDCGTTFKNHSVIFADSATHRFTNPMFIVDGSTIWLMAFKSDKDHTWQDNDEIGVGDYAPVYAKSTDDGETWQTGDLNDLLTSASFYGVDVVCMFNGCGHGIKLSNGTLVMPAQCRMSNNNTAQDEGGAYKIQSCIVYSTDNGTTWTRSNLVPSYTSECQCIEWNGYVYINCRSYCGKRKIYRTNDLGTTWEHVDGINLVEPVECEASWAVCTDGGRSSSKRIAFVNPDDSKKRVNLSVKVSDNLTDWQTLCVLFYPEGLGYSDIAVRDDGIIVVIYEDYKNKVLRLSNITGYIATRR